jgi:hypothetical protein
MTDSSQNPQALPVQAEDVRQLLMSLLRDTVREFKEELAQQHTQSVAQQQAFVQSAQPPKQSFSQPAGHGGTVPGQMPYGRQADTAANAPDAPLATPVPADIVCGKEGTVKIGATDLPEITKWSWKPTVTTQEYASNMTGGFKRRVCGSKAASGSVEGKWNRTDSIITHFTEGSTVTLLLYIDATRYISAPALIKTLSIDVNINDNAITGWTADFDSDGPYVYNL